MAGEGKDPETRTPQTENATPKTRTKGTGTGEGGRGGSRQTTNNKQQTRSQSLFAADFLTIANIEKYIRSEVANALVLIRCKCDKLVHVPAWIRRLKRN